MIAIVLAISNVLASLTLLGALAALGVPAYALARRFGLTDRAPLGLCWLFGLVWLSALTWYGLAAGIRPSSAYRGLLIAAPILGGLALVLLRPRPEQGLRSNKALATDVGFDLLAFTVTVAVYAGLLFSKLQTGDLPWATIFNGDIYVYLKSAAWLAFDPVVVPGVGYMEFSKSVAADVFGCFNLLAFERFVLHTGIEYVPIPTLGVAIGMIGVAVARSCRVVFRLGSPLSIALALTTTTGPVFLYVVLNYFLAQIVFASVLLTVALTVLEFRDGGARDVAGRNLVLAAGAAAAVLSYDVWALQYAVLIAALLAVAEAVTVGGGLWWRGLVAGLSFAARVALALGVMALASPTRLMLSYEKVILDSVPNGAGWPLPFVDLNLLLGLPVEWQGMEAPRPGILGPNLGFALMIAILLIALGKLDRGPGHVARRLTLGCFCATLLAYLVVWLKFGETYQQWKFASTLTLGFGFAVLASVAALARAEPSRGLRALVGVGIAAFLATCVIFNIGIARDNLMGSLGHHPSTLASLVRSLDAELGGKPIHVTIDDFSARHEALVMLNHRPATFDNLSMFGPSPPPPADGRWTELTTTCGSAGKPEALYVAAPAAHGHLPSLIPGVEVPLAGDAATCVTLSGFGGIQPTGRTTEAKVATIRFRCACAPVPGGYNLVLHVALPDGVDRETVRFTVNGASPQMLSLTGSGVRDIGLPLPVGLADGGLVEVSIEVTGGPAAAPPALSVAGLVLVKRS